MLPDSIKDLPPKTQLAIALRERVKRRRENKLAAYSPYDKQLEFHGKGATDRERLFMAGNQLGKTWSGAYEVAYHVTGIYPDWWNGRRFPSANVGWASGVTSESVRETTQRLLLGRPGEFGTGTIPKRLIIDIKMARGVPDAVDSVTVRHVNGDISRITFKSYEKGREKWQGETLDWVWFDEEPPQAIYTEGLTRTNATGGMAFMTFTPLLGMSDVVRRFIVDKPIGTSVTVMTIYDVGHYTKEEADAIVATYPAHEREARSSGTPTLGSGRIFPVSEELITCEPFEIPKHWVQVAGIDFGWDHPTAAVRLAWDRDDDVIYVTASYRLKAATPAIHSLTLKHWGDWLPWAWPHDGLQHDKGSGDQLASLYEANGLAVLASRATFEDGKSNGVEAGLMEMLDMMQEGRFRVFSNLNDWFEEFRLYHRKDGKVVKKADDLMAATRYAYMMRRFAKSKPRPAGAARAVRKASWKTM